MLRGAKVPLEQAGQIALKKASGTLLAVGFNDENGMGVYEAMILGADGQASIVKIDAQSGAVLGKCLDGLSLVRSLRVAKMGPRQVAQGRCSSGRRSRISSRRITC